MIKLAANLSMMFTEHAFLDRFQAAADCGFKGVEFMFPYSFATDEIATAAARSGIEIVLFNLPAGDWDSGERGIGAHPDRIVEARAGAARALDYARDLGCSKLHLMAGKAPAEARCRHALIDNLRYAADLVGPHGVTLLIEPINTKVDIPGYFYATTSAAESVIREAARDNVRLQYDIYHMQIMEGDLARTIEQLLPIIGHIQLADNPGRAEPGTGEIRYDWLLGEVDGLGYNGWIGCEYRPTRDTAAGLGWAVPYLDGRGHGL